MEEITLRVTPEEFLKRVLSREAYDDPSDTCNVSELKNEYKLPPWYDEKKFKIGQKFYKDNLFGHMACKMLGLIAVISVPTILRVLVSSRRSSSSLTAFRRYTSTFVHAMIWSTVELKPGTESWKSLLTVRERHLRAGKGARARGVGTVSQRDLCLTQFGFVGYLLLHPDRVGLHAYDRGAYEGLVHIYAVVGSMIGIKDKYNLCLGTVEEVTEVCRLMMERVFSPLLEFPVEPFEHMAYVILDGLWSLFPLLRAKSFMYMTRVLSKVPGYVYTEQERLDFKKKLKNGGVPKEVAPVLKEWHTTWPRDDFREEDFKRLDDVPYYKRLNFVDRIMLHSVAFLFQVYSFRPFKFLLNKFMALMIFLVRYMPLLSFHRFGFKMSFVDIFQEDVKDDTKPMTNAEMWKMYNTQPWYVKYNPFVNKE